MRFPKWLDRLDQRGLPRPHRQRGTGEPWRLVASSDFASGPVDMVGLIAYGWWPIAYGLRTSDERGARGAGPGAGLQRELTELRDQVARLTSDNARLLKLLNLTPAQGSAPGPAQTGIFDGPPAMVDAASLPAAKVAFFAAMFTARTDVYVVRWENARTGRSGWLPAVRGGWRGGADPGSRHYLPLTGEVLAAHLSGEIDLGLYPLLEGDRCWWLAADFDGPAAMLDALAYLKAARAVGAPVALEVSRSGVGAHAWLFFAGPGAGSDSASGGYGVAP